MMTKTVDTCWKTKRKKKGEKTGTRARSVRLRKAHLFGYSGCVRRTRDVTAPATGGGHQHAKVVYVIIAATSWLLSVRLPAGSFQSCTTTREFHITGGSGHRVLFSRYLTRSACLFASSLVFFF